MGVAGSVTSVVRRFGARAPVHPADTTSSPLAQRSDRECSKDIDAAINL